MRLYSYDRTSVWDHQKISNEAQREQNKQRAMLEYDEEPNYFYDYGKSGGNVEREGFQSLRRHIQQSYEPGVLYVHRYDRISRNLSDAISFMKLCTDHNIRVCSISEPLPVGTGQGLSVQTMFAQSLFIFAEMQRATIIENVRSGISFKRSKGKYISSNVPFGYRLNQGEIIQDEKESITVQRLFELYNTKKYGYKRLIDQLSKEGLTYKGGPFKEHNIWSILKNPLYYGEIKGGSFGSYQGDFQPIIDKEVFDYATRIRGSRTVRKTDTRIYSLRQKINCPYCQQKLSPKKQQNNGEFYFYYHCANRGCQGIYIEALAIESEVKDLLSSFFQSEGVYQQLISEIEYSIDELNKQEQVKIRKAIQSKEVVIQRFEQGEITLEELKEYINQIKERKKTVARPFEKENYQMQLRELLKLKDQSIQQLIFEQVSHVEVSPNKGVIGLYLFGVKKNVVKKAG